MGISSDLASAVHRAEFKRTIRSQIRTVFPDAAERRTFLLDLIAEDESTSENAKPTTAHASPKPERSRRARARAAKKVVGRQKPRTPHHDRDDGRTDKLFALLAKTRGAPIGDLTKQIYGDAAKGSQANLRSLLVALKAQGRVNNYERGKWEVVQKQ